MSVSSEKMYERPDMPSQFDELEDFEEQEQVETRSQSRKNARRTGGKRTAKTVGIILLVGGITVSGVVGYLHGTQALNAQKFVSAFANEYQEELVEFPSEVYTEKGYDSKICSGEMLVNALRTDNIKYCEILDEYYTEDGRNIAIVTANVQGQMSCEPVKTHTINGNVYTAPVGYVLSNGVCVKNVDETVKKVVEVREDGDYSNVCFTLPGGATVTSCEILDVEVVSTKTYTDIADKDLVCDVPDQVTVVDDKYVAKLSLGSK